MLPPPGTAPSARPLDGLDLRTDAQLELLARLSETRFQDLFQTLRADPVINPDSTDPPGPIRNGFYPTPDAELYAALILLERPERIIEVGSGFSTAVARAAITAGSLDTELHVIDPEPRRSVEAVAHRIEYARVEESSLASSGVAADSLLFVDSSHVTRSGGDGPFLYGTLLPGLPAGVLVHVHDVFLPYDYPQVYVERLYTEQYLLQALLANSRKFEVVLATFLLSQRHPDRMRRVLGDAVARDGRHEGASFWMRSIE